MLSKNPRASIFIPDRIDATEALARTTHLAVGAHSDDLEIMAYRGIIRCYAHDDLWFTGVTCTDGSGSSRVGPYAKYSDEQLVAIRAEEQNQAAVVGKYGAMLQLGYPSATIKQRESTELIRDLDKILEATRPRYLYTHNPADKHDTHIAVMQAVIRAVKRMPADQRPVKVFGCEVWRDLDWMLDDDKVPLDVSERENLANALVGVFDSQITGGKRYDKAAVGRRYTNATFFYAKQEDKVEQVTFAMDLTPVIADDGPPLTEYVLAFIDRFRDEVRENLEYWS